MKKKVLMSMVLLAIIGTSAVFAQQPTPEKLKFNAINKNSEYSAAQDNNKISGQVVIPAIYNGKPVTTVTSMSGKKLPALFFPRA